MKEFKNAIGWNCKEFRIFKYANESDYKERKVQSIQIVKGNTVTMNGLMTLWHLATEGAQPVTSPADAINPEGFYPFDVNSQSLYIGVGNGNQPSSVLDNSLKGDSTSPLKAYKVASTVNYQFVRNDSTNPKSGGVSVIFETSFEANDANFEWKEWGIFNGNPASLATNRTLPEGDLSLSGSVWTNVSGKDFNVVMLNRRVEIMGTKQQGAVWTVQVEIELNNAGGDSTN